ncbi:hypothetical protein ABID26_005740 [Mesorhizobium shonense]|uniref:RNA polymerase sigma factor 70 region 4 type 2 domain-containing protein n=1 Tax=Mesorhizobium shonense TaxID=1209948 RepID=A0ABV2I090_9HYPH
MRALRCCVPVGRRESVDPRGGGTSQESTVVRNEPLLSAPKTLSFELVRLSPLERVVFVFCNAFDLTFDEIASVADLEGPQPDF